MLKVITILFIVPALGSFSGCKTKPEVSKEDSTPYHPANTDTYWAKGTDTKEVSAKLDLTSGIIEFIGKEGKKGFTKSMPFGQIQPGLYKFVSVANEEIVYQSGTNTITLSSSSPSSSLYVPVDGYRIIESMQPALEVQAGILLGGSPPYPEPSSDLSSAPSGPRTPANGNNLPDNVAIPSSQQVLDATLPPLIPPATTP
jgi:hypothetical protein